MASGRFARGAVLAGLDAIAQNVERIPLPSWSFPTKVDWCSNEFRVGSCDFVDRPCLDKRNDPRASHELKTKLVTAPIDSLGKSPSWSISEA